MTLVQLDQILGNVNDFPLRRAAVDQKSPGQTG